MAAGSKFGKELQAIQSILDALEPLDESQRQFVLRTVADRLGLPAPGGAGGGAGGGSGAGGGAGSGSGGSGGAASGAAATGEGLTPAKFMALKKPASDIERITCLAYLLKRSGTSIFVTRDLSKMNTTAAGGEFSNASFAANNALKAHLLAKAGGKNKQLTMLGEMVVEALPDREAVKKAIEEHKPRRKPNRRRGAKSANK